MYLLLYGHGLMDALELAYDLSLSNAVDPVPLVSFVSEIPTMPKIQDSDASGSQKCQGGDGGVGYSGKSTATGPPAHIRPHEEVEDASLDPSDDEGLNADDVEDPDDDYFAIPFGDEILKG